MQNYDIAAYIWPSYTGKEIRARQFWEQGIGEWQTIQNPLSKEGWTSKHPQPLWGFVDEADKEVMELQIEKAAEYGVNVFIYDWYWYDGRPFLEQCLDEGYLQAENNDKVKFYLLWANHDATYLWDRRNSHLDNVVWSGAADEKQFDIITDRVIKNYFSHPSYYKINNKPVFMIYDLVNFIRGLGGVDGAKNGIELFRNKVKAAGFDGLELQLCVWSENSVDIHSLDENYSGSTKDAVELLGFDSVTNYQYIQFTEVSREYDEIFEDVKNEWHRLDSEYSVPYYPHVSVGWDNNWRFVKFKWGFMRNNTTEKFKMALEEAKSYLDSHPEQAKLITVNSWNEWTEGSYLEPDDINGYGYLEAVKQVFLK